jgi:hypothetical protein
MSTTLVNEAAQTPPPPPPPVHPPLPFNLGSKVALSGISGAIAAFIIAWWQSTPSWHMTPAVAALGVTAGASIIGFFQGRSQQAAKLIETVRKDLGAAGISISGTPPS